MNSKIFVIPVMLVMVCLAMGQEVAELKPDIVPAIPPCKLIRCPPDQPYCCPGTGRCVRDPKECRCRGNRDCPRGTYCCKPSPFRTGFCLHDLRRCPKEMNLCFGYRTDFDFLVTSSAQSLSSNGMRPGCRKNCALLAGFFDANGPDYSGCFPIKALRLRRMFQSWIDGGHLDWVREFEC